MAKSLNIPHSEKMIDTVLNVVLNWKRVFIKYGVPDLDIERLEWDIDTRLDGLSGEAVTP